MGTAGAGHRRQAVDPGGGLGGANIAEGSGRGTYRHNRRFVDISHGSLYETRHWLRRASRRKLLNKAQSDALRPVIDELGPRLNAYRKSIRPSPPPNGPQPVTSNQ